MAGRRCTRPRPRQRLFAQRLSQSVALHAQPQDCRAASGARTRRREPPTPSHQRLAHWSAVGQPHNTTRERSANRTYCARVDVVRALGQRLVAGPRQQHQTPRPGRRPGGCAAASAAREGGPRPRRLCEEAAAAKAAKAAKGHSETRRPQFQHETTWKQGLKTTPRARSRQTPQFWAASLLARAGAPSRRSPTTCGRRSPPTPSTARARPRSRRSTVRAMSKKPEL